MRPISPLILIMLATGAVSATTKSDREGIVKAFDLPVRNLKRADSNALMDHITNHVSSLGPSELPDAVGTIFETIFEKSWSKDEISTALQAISDAPEGILEIGGEISLLSPRDSNLGRLTVRLGYEPKAIQSRASDYVLTAGVMLLESSDPDAFNALCAEIKAGVVASDALASADLVSIVNLLKALDGMPVTALWPEMATVVSRDLGHEGGRVNSASMGPVLDAVATWSAEQIASALDLIQKAFDAKPATVILEPSTASSGPKATTSARGKRAQDALDREAAAKASAAEIDALTAMGFEEMLSAMGEDDRLMATRVLASVRAGAPLSRQVTRFDSKAVATYTTTDGRAVEVKPRTVPMHTTTAVQAELGEVVARHGLGNIQRLRRLAVGFLCLALGERRAADLVCGDVQETNGGQKEDGASD